MFLNALVSSADGAMNDSELRTALNLENNMQLSGIATTAFKEARRVGIDPLYTKEISGRKKARSQLFSVPPTLLIEIRKALKERWEIQSARRLKQQCRRLGPAALLRTLTTPSLGG
jgi:hypothetical protein